MNVHPYIILSANAPNVGPEQLPPPEIVEDVRAIPKAITGLERRYLEALQKNVTARKHYLGLLHNHTEHPRNSLTSLQVTRLSDHVDLLRLRRRHRELGVLQKYLTKLKHSDAARPDFLDTQKIKTDHLESILFDEQHRDAGRPQPYGPINALVRELEVVVIVAKHQLDQERQLLSEIEEEAATLPPLVKQNNRARALAGTRDELVAWMEGKLANSPSVENGQENEVREGNQTESPMGELEHEIREKYDNYLKARERIVDLISTLEPPAQQPPLKRAQASKTDSTASTEPCQPPTSSLLPFFRTQIQQPSHVLQFYRQQNVHLTTLIKNEHSKITSELCRLAHESHLIPTHPVPTPEDRFKHAAAATTSRPSPSQTIGGAKQNEMSQKVAAWTFAAKAASQATEEIVMEHLDQGRGAVRDGERWLGQLKDLLGSGGDSEQENDGRRNVDGVKEYEEDDDDVWALEASAGPLNNKKQAVKHNSGPSAGLRGDVGIKET